MTTRRFLVPAASALAVVAIAAGVGVIANRDTASDSPSRAQVGSPKLPALSIGSGNDTAMAAAGAPESDAKIGAPQGNGVPTVTIKGELPAATDALVAAYRLERRPVTKEDVVKLAAALGLKGEPKPQAGGWQVGDGNRFLTVEPSLTLDWRLMPGDAACMLASSGSGSAGESVGGSTGSPGIAVDPAQPPTPLPPDTPVAEKPAKEEAPLPPESPGVAQPGAKDLPLSDPPPDPGGPAVTPIPQPCGGSVSSDVACAPPGAQTLVACPTVEAKPVPTEAVARATALDLAKRIGVTVEDGDARVDQGYDGVRHVSVRRRVKNTPTEGLMLDVSVDAAGQVVSANGQLAEPVLAGEYPMLPPAELAQTVANQRVTTMMCVLKPGVEGCAPPPPIVVTGASIGLSMTYPADWEKGEAYLLPAWFFSIEGDPNPVAVVAVPNKYRTEPEPAVDPGTIEPGIEPGTIEPAPLPPSELVDPAITPEPRPADPGPATSTLNPATGADGNSTSFATVPPSPTAE